jgi:hypothetical protein
VDFEVLLDVVDIETFAVGRGIRERRRSNGDMAKGGGENGRVEPGFGWRTARFETPKCTGTKRPASAARN